MKRSRRDFMKLLAAGAAAAAAAPAGALARTATTKRTTTRTRRTATTAPRPPRPAPQPADALAAEIEKQKGYVAAALKTLRSYELPTGSELAFVFKPLAARKERAS